MTKEYDILDVIVTIRHPDGTNTTIEMAESIKPVRFDSYGMKSAWKRISKRVKESIVIPW